MTFNIEISALKKKYHPTELNIASKYFLTQSSQSLRKRRRDLEIALKPIVLKVNHQKDLTGRTPFELYLA